MARVSVSSDEVVRRGKEIWERSLRPHLEAANTGKFVVINVETGEYEIAEDEDGTLEASDRLHGKQPDAALYTLRIGYPAATFLGSVPFGSIV